MTASDALPALGQRALDLLQRLGHSAFFFLDLLRNAPAALRRFYLVIAQVHAIGNYSLVIIAASGLAVGFVLALQGYYTLSRYGAAESLGFTLQDGTCVLRWRRVVSASRVTMATATRHWRNPARVARRCRRSVVTHRSRGRRSPRL